MGESPQPIQYSEIFAYCELQEIHDPEYRSRMVTVVKALDAIYMEKVADERKKVAK